MCCAYSIGDDLHGECGSLCERWIICPRQPEAGAADNQWQAVAVLLHRGTSSRLDDHQSTASAMDIRNNKRGHIIPCY